MSIVAKSYRKRREIKQKEDVIHAYLISRWVWHKRIDIDRVLNKIGSEVKTILTDEQMFEQVKILNKLFGGEVKTCKT